MTRVLFVCHGNICRSPMAEFCMKDLVRQAGLGDQFVIDSAATSTEEIWNGIGNPVYPPAKKELVRHGLDHNNLRNMHRIFGQDPEGKIQLLLDYTDHPGDIADPWYTGDFETTWDDILRGCKGLLQQLQGI